MKSYTAYMANVSQPTYETIVNFCADNGIENVPLANMMGYLLQIKDGSHGRMQVSLGKSFLMNDLEVVQMEATSGTGSILFVEGVCPPLVQMCKDLKKKDDHEELDILVDDETVGFVLAYDVEGDVDLEKLTRELKAYLNDSVIFESFSTHYVNEESILDFVDGIDPLTVE